VGNTASSSNHGKNPFTVIPNSQQESQRYFYLNIVVKGHLKLRSDNHIFLQKRKEKFKV